MSGRTQEITEMLGYTDTNALLEAIGSGEVILIKIDDAQRFKAAKWLLEKAPEVQSQNEALGNTLKEIALGLDLAMELNRYPAGADICDIDLPNGWPSYCEKGNRE